MGDPATPPPSERRETHELAARIVESVRNDEPMPHGLLTWRECAGGRELCHASDAEELIFRLAQELELTRRERDEACFRWAQFRHDEGYEPDSHVDKLRSIGKSKDKP